MLAKTAQAVCPSTVLNGTNTTIISVSANGGSLSVQCKVVLRNDSVDDLVASINDGLAQCGLDRVVACVAAEYMTSPSAPNSGALCSKLSLVLADGGVGGVYTVSASASSGPLSFSGTPLLFNSAPAFATLEDAGAMSDVYYNPSGQALGVSAWITANLTDFAPGDIAPSEVYAVLPRNPSLWSYSGTHVSTSETINARLASRINARCATSSSENETRIVA